MEVPPRRSRAPSVLALVVALAVAETTGVFAAPDRRASASEGDRTAHPARVLSRHVEGGYETLVVSVDAGTCVDPWNRGWHVRLDGAAGEPLPWSGLATQSHADLGSPVAAPVTTAAASPAPDHPTLTLVVRRVAAAAEPPATPPPLLHLYAPADCGSSAAPMGQHLRFTLPETSALPDDPRAFSTYLLELGQKLRFGSPFGAFAQARLHGLAEERFKATAPPAPPRPSRQALRKLGVVGLGHHDVGTAPVRPAPSVPRRTPSDLAQLMSSTADAMSLQELLQQDGRLAAYSADERATIPIDKLDAPTFVARPWRALQDGLAQPVPAEPLADATPAEFYFARFAGLPQLLLTLDGWLAHAMVLLGDALSGADFGNGTPSLSPTAIDRSIAARYLTELGLPGGLREAALASGISAEVAGEVAIVGSDPYLREGSDLTLIWRPRREGPRVGAAAATAAPGAGAGADRAWAAALADVAARHGGVVFDDRDEGGVVVHAARSADGAIRQYRASAGGFELCSNSAGAVRRVLAAIAGHAPRLGDMRAFRYLLARDAGTPADGLLFVCERFFSRVLAAPLKVLEARRQLALGELETPGLAALLFGWINGRAPASVDELVASGLLHRDELAHRGGETIAWTPGRAARSSWGTPAALTPLIDLPAPTTVTTTERDAYRIFVERHERDWRATLGSIAVRIGSTGGTGRAIDLVDVRTAPFADGDGSVYGALARVVGEARLATGRGGAGARIAIGIDPDGEPRRWLRQLVAPAFAGRLPPGDWLGDWAMVGIEDSPAPALASLLRGGARVLDLVDLLRLGPDSGGSPLDLPVYAGVAVRDEAAADVFLRHVRTALDPTLLDWRAFGQQRGVAITRVQRRVAAGAGAQAAPMRPVYLAVCRSTLAVALAEQTLRHRIDECLDGLLPRLEAKSKLKRADLAPASTAGAEGSADAHLVADVDLSPRGSLWGVVGALVDRLAAQDDGASVAEAIFRGVPGLDVAGASALANAYLGGAPVTREGSSYFWSEAGVASPLRGTAYAPRRPGAAGAAGPRAQLDALAHARLEMSLDSEPALSGGEVLRSVHVRLTNRPRAR